eukprot:jgi/Ulvmu1/1881/UM012_0038.1
MPRGVLNASSAVPLGGCIAGSDRHAAALRAAPSCHSTPTPHLSSPGGPTARPRWLGHQIARVRRTLRRAGLLGNPGLCGLRTRRLRQLE